LWNGTFRPYALLYAAFWRRKANSSSKTSSKPECPQDVFMGNHFAGTDLGGRFFDGPSVAGGNRLVIRRRG
jgi:hypothetical protein